MTRTRIAWKKVSLVGSLLHVGVRWHQMTICWSPFEAVYSQDLHEVKQGDLSGMLKGARYHDICWISCLFFLILISLLPFSSASFCVKVSIISPSCKALQDAACKKMTTAALGRDRNGNSPWFWVTMADAQFSAKPKPKFQCTKCAMYSYYIHSIR